MPTSWSLIWPLFFRFSPEWALITHCNALLQRLWPPCGMFQAGRSATFFAFMLPDKEQAAKVNQVLRDNQAGAINFGENTWHFYPSWEHLLEGKTLAHNSWPFDAHGKRCVIYDPEALPVSVELMSRTLVYQVPVNLSEGRRDTMLAALDAAVKL